MDFTSLLQQLKDARQNDPMFESAKIAENRFKQNINPVTAEQTPQEKDYYNNLIGAVAGSVVPVKGSGEAIKLGQDALQGIMNPSDVELAKELANHAVESGNMSTVQKTQQALSRAQDFADRNKFQRLQKLLNK